MEDRSQQRQMNSLENPLIPLDSHQEKVVEPPVDFPFNFEYNFFASVEERFMVDRLKIKLNCRFCSNGFHPFHRDQKFCSRACYLIFRRKNLKRKIRKCCPVCNRIFEVFPSKDSKLYCSKSCYAIDQQIRLDIDSIIHQYQAGKSTAELGKIYGVSWSTIARALKRAKVPLRSRTAHLKTEKNPTKNKGHSERTKAKLRATAIKQFANPKARKTASENQTRAMSEGRVSNISALENQVAGILKQLGIEFKRQVGIPHPDTRQFCACVDFLLQNKRVLEINGTYWHADPRKYPDGPIYQSQKRTVKRYREKVKILHSLGYAVLELWEIDFRSDPTGSIKQLLNL